MKIVATNINDQRFYRRGVAQLLHENPKLRAKQQLQHLFSKGEINPPEGMISESRRMRRE